MAKEIKKQLIVDDPLQETCSNDEWLSGRL